jgi:hypothetical protein
MADAILGDETIVVHSTWCELREIGAVKHKWRFDDKGETCI